VKYLYPTKKYWQSSNQVISSESKDILNEYLLSLKLENKAELTITKYRAILERFFTECPVPLESLTSNDVLKWLQHFSIGKKEKSVALALSTLSTFFNFCIAEDYMHKVVVKTRWRPKIPETLPKFLTEQEYARVQMTAEQLSVRDRAIVLFLFSSGCRRSEVSELNMGDINLDRRTTKVKGKGTKIRHTHFSEECALVLREYLRHRSDEYEPLFLNRYGQRLSPQSIYTIMTKLGKRAGLTQRLHPHSCRHTFATRMLAKGADLEFIGDEMGHSDLNTTRVYARIPSDEMILAYQNKMG